MDNIAQNDIQVIYLRGQYKYTNERPRFEDAVYGCVPTRYGEDICHYISFDYMRRVLVDSANMFCTGDIQEGEFISNLNWLTQAVQADDRGIYQIDQRLDVSTRIKTKISRGEDMSPELNWLLQRLNNELSNLRPGLSSWNKSIGAEYDPFAWVHCDSAGIVDSSNCEEKLGEQRAEADCFYFAGNADINKFKCLNELVSIGLPSIYTAEIDGQKVLYSSNNRNFDFAAVTEVSECPDTVFWI